MAAPAAPAADPQAAVDQAGELMDAARDAFHQGDYAGALAQCDKAIAIEPNDPLYHEFRSLALFALHRYDEAASAIYAVLSAGPGWDWTTLVGLYADVNVYTEQLRGLEQYVLANANSPAAKFLLAYHYTICGHTDAAAYQLQGVVKLDPKDRLSPQLLAMLTPPKAAAPAASPAPAAPAAPAAPVQAASLVGDWKATRPDGATIALSLTQDGQYTWKYGESGKEQQFTGPYTVADNLLILKKGQTPMMIGQVSQLSSDRFNFKLPGDNPADPGLTFGK
jgi:tetratricopeptide (TPR) repeat protein